MTIISRTQPTQSVNGSDSLNAEHSNHTNNTLNNATHQTSSQEYLQRNYLFGRAICPHARRFMMGLAEKHIPYTFEMEMSQSNDDSLPIFLHNNEIPVSGSYAIIEYLESNYKQVNLLGGNIYEQNETRRLINWCDTTLYNQITHPFIFEKIHKRIWHLGAPEHETLKNVRKNISQVLSIANDILSDREYFSCNRLTWADITLAAHISCLDYLNEINWMLYDTLYVWYLKIKSRQSFVTILHEKVAAIPPALHYSSIDFDQDAQKTVRFSL